MFFEGWGFPNFPIKSNDSDEWLFLLSSVPLVVSLIFNFSCALHSRQKSSYYVICGLPTRILFIFWPQLWERSPDIALVYVSVSVSCKGISRLILLYLLLTLCACWALADWLTASLFISSCKQRDSPVHYIITTLVNNRCNSFDVVCLCMHLSHSPDQTDRLTTWILAGRSSGRISRSNSKVKVINRRSRSPGKKTFFFSGNVNRMSCWALTAHWLMCRGSKQVREMSPDSSLIDV